MSAQRIRILLADDHPVVRRGVRLILDEQPDMEVVAEAGDGVEAVERAIEAEADLALLDVAMPRLNGTQAARHLGRHRPDMKLVMLSMYGSEQYCAEALRCGASGYLVKSAADRELVAACRAAMRGERFISPSLALGSTPAELAGSSDVEPESVGPLTPRETEVVKLVAEGHTTREIADALTISEKTVERHRGNALEKLGMRDRVDLTRYAIRRGLIQP